MDSLTFKNRILTLSDQSFRLAKSILKNTRKAEDAVQELNIKLWEKRETLNDIDNMPAFIMRSMRNLCLDMLRKSHKEEELDEKLEYSELNPHQAVERKDISDKISLIIDSLPEVQRNIIRLRDVEGMETTEIACVMGMTENAVHVNLSRARFKVRERIRKMLNSSGF